MLGTTIPLAPYDFIYGLTNCLFSSMAWFGYDQGVFSGVLISADFKKHFPETNNPNISGITSSCFAV